MILYDPLKNQVVRPEQQFPSGARERPQTRVMRQRLTIVILWAASFQRNACNVLAKGALARTNLEGRTLFRVQTRPTIELRNQWPST